MESKQSNRGAFLLLILASIWKLSSQSACPLFRCSPESVSLDYDSLNSTLDIKCYFVNRIEDPSDIMWRFNFNKAERIINDLDGGILAPFRHILRHASSSSSSNHSNSNRYGNAASSSGSQSLLRIHLLNSSYYTNYTIMHTRDSCQQTIRIRLGEQALGYSQASALSQVPISYFYTLSFSWLLLCRFSTS